jgi:hypothetical protein
MTEFENDADDQLCGALAKEDLEKLMAQLKTVVPEVMDNIAHDWIIESSMVIAKDIEEGNIATKGNEYDTLLAQLHWHIRRKGKFGASDMSALYMEFKDMWYPFGDAAGIVAEKLCMKPIEPMNGDTSRGVFVEDHCREAFIRLMRKQDIYLVEDDYAKKALSALRYSGGIPETPWMDCSPDDIFLDQDGRRYLIDYKCPAESSTVESMQRDVPEYYKAQLAQEKIMLEYLGLPPDRIILAPFSTKDWKVYPVDCVISDEMCMDVVNAGNYYRGFLETRELPRRPASKDYQYVHQLPSALQDVILEFAVHNKGKLIHEAEEDRTKSRMLELMQIHKIDIDDHDKKIGMPMINHRWQTTRRVNTQALQNALTELGVDVNDDKFYNETESRVLSLDRGKYNSFSAIRDGVENFMAGQVANDRAFVVDEFRQKFKDRDGVTVEKPKPEKKPKNPTAKAPAPASEPSPF